MIIESLPVVVFQASGKFMASRYVCCAEHPLQMAPNGQASSGQQLVPDDVWPDLIKTATVVRLDLRDWPVGRHVDIAGVALRLLHSAAGGRDGGAGGGIRRPRIEPDQQPVGRCRRLVRHNRIGRGRPLGPAIASPDVRPRPRVRRRNALGYPPARHPIGQCESLRGMTVRSGCRRPPLNTPALGVSCELTGLGGLSLFAAQAVVWCP